MQAQVDTSSAPYRVARNTIATSVVGALATLAYEATRAKPFSPDGQVGVHRVVDANADGPKASSTGLHRPVRLLAASAALNSGIIAFMFFSLREYAVSPLLSSWRARQTVPGAPGFEPEAGHNLSGTLSWSDLRTRRVLDSGLAGVIVGAVANAKQRGAPFILRGGLTGGLGCTLVQLLFNEANVTRIKFVSGSEEVNVGPGPNRQKSEERWGSASNFEAGDGSNDVSASAEGSTFNTASVTGEYSPSWGRNQNRPGAKPKEKTKEAQQNQDWGDWILSRVGVRRLSDEEYLAKMVEKREGYMRRIRELEKELGSDEWNPSKGGGDERTNEQR